MGITDVAGILVLTLFILGVVSLFTRVTIFEFQRGILYRSGRFARVLDPGRYLFYRPKSRVTVVDVRAQVVTVPNQEVLTSDTVAVRCSVSGAYRVVDAQKAVHEAVSAQDALYLALQMALRELVSTATADELLARRNELSQALFERAAPAAEVLGLALESAGIRDITFPGELKKVFAQAAQAEKAAQAALTKARAETATLRSLANAARLMEANPALLSLRTLHTLGELARTAGNTIVVGLPSPTLPLLVQGDQSLPAPSKEIETPAEE